MTALNSRNSTFSSATGAPWQAQVDALNNLAEFLLHREPQRVYAITTNSFELAGNDYPEGQVRSRVIAARSLGQQGHYALAVHAFLEAQRLCRLHGLKRLQLPTLNGLGLAHILNGEYASALHVLQESLQLACASHDLQNVCRTLNHLAFLCTYTGDYDVALQYHQAARTVAQHLDDAELRLTTDANVGFSCLQTSRLPEAQHLLESSLVGARAAGLRRVECVVMLNLARLQERLNLLEPALVNLEAVLSCVHELKLHELQCAAQIDKARILRRQERPADGLRLLEPALHQARFLRLVRRELEALEELCEVHRHLNSVETAHSVLAVQEFRSTQVLRIKTQQKLGYVNLDGVLKQLVLPGVL